MTDLDDFHMSVEPRWETKVQDPVESGSEQQDDISVEQSPWVRQTTPKTKGHQTTAERGAERGRTTQNAMQKESLSSMHTGCGCGRGLGGDPPGPSSSHTVGVLVGQHPFPHGCGEEGETSNLHQVPQRGLCTPIGCS